MAYFGVGRLLCSVIFLEILLILFAEALGAKTQQTETNSKTTLSSV